MLLCLDVDFSVFVNSQIGPQWFCYVTRHVLQCGTYIIVFMINFKRYVWKWEEESDEWGDFR